jgi:hypothetical protein
MQQLNKPATKAARGAQNFARKHFQRVHRDIQSIIKNTAVLRTKRKNPRRNKNVDYGQIQLLSLTAVAYLYSLAPVANNHNDRA